MQTSKTTIHVALKEFRADLPEVRAEWVREAQALKTFNNLKSPHIIRGVAAFTRRDKHYLMMEWADGSNLGEFWLSKEHQKPDLTSRRILEVLGQLRGLVEAVKNMHEYQMPDDHLAEKEVVSTVDGIPTIIEPENTAKKPNWRHGDLKPANILRFLPTDPKDWLGTLKIGDLGRAKLHEQVTRDREKQFTSELFTSMHYEPPEVEKALEKAWSRLFDVWSLGCIFFECIVWLLYGYDAIKNVFNLNGKMHQSPYWIITNWLNKTADVSALVSGWIDEMLEKDHECKPSPDGVGAGGGTAIGDLLTVVRDKMLVVATPDDPTIYVKGLRAPASTLLKDLDKIIVKASAPGNKYAFTGKERVVVSPPPKESRDQQSLTPDQAWLTPGHIPKRRTSSPFLGRLDTDPTESYRHEYEDRYDVVEDNRFVLSVLQRRAFDAKSRLPKDESKFCRRCQGLDFLSIDMSITDVMSELESRAKEGCQFCALLLQAADVRNPNAIIQFKRTASGLCIDSTRLPVISIVNISCEYNIEAPRL